MFCFLSFFLLLSFFLSHGLRRFTQWSTNVDGNVSRTKRFENECRNMSLEVGDGGDKVQGGNVKLDD